MSTLNTRKDVPGYERHSKMTAKPYITKQIVLKMKYLQWNLRRGITKEASAFFVSLQQADELCNKHAYAVNKLFRWYRRDVHSCTTLTQI